MPFAAEHVHPSSWTPAAAAAAAAPDSLQVGGESISQPLVGIFNRGFGEGQIPPGEVLWSGEELAVSLSVTGLLLK